MAAPLYRALRKSYLHDRLVAKGEEFTYDGIPSIHWEPLNEPAKKKKELIKDSSYKRMMDARRAAKDASESAAPAKEEDDDEDDKDLSESQKQAALATALAKLDHTNDDHWTKTGEPRLDVLSEFAGYDVPRVDVKVFAPAFVREKV